MPSHDSRQILTSPVKVPISPCPSPPPITKEKSRLPSNPTGTGPAKSKQKCAGNRTAEGVHQSALADRIRSLLLDPLQGPLKTAHQSKGATSPLSPGLLRNLGCRLGHYTPWQLIVIFAFAFYTVTFFRALTGAGYIPNNDLQHDLQHRYGSSMKGHPHRGAHTAFSSIFGRLQLLTDLMGQHATPKELNDTPHNLKSATVSISGNVQQRADHRSRAAGWKTRKGKPRRMGSGVSDEPADREEADTPQHEGFAYAISHSDLHRRVLAEHGGEVTEPDTQSYQPEFEREASD
ncbi:hypothetical protein BU17DRAFT_81637 [Hysterangium stoloniferum]|nr:hypothetical protein BU17DRAFT_81637 [Hysterangium stoloniferum]